MGRFFNVCKNNVNLAKDFKYLLVLTKFATFITVCIFNIKKHLQQANRKIFFFVRDEKNEEWILKIYIFGIM